MSTPRQYLDTSFIRDERGRIVSTQEPVPTAGALFCLVRGACRCAWAIHAQIADDVAHAIEKLARSEPPAADVRRPPLHANEYRKLLGAHLATRQGGTFEPLEHSGPAMTFPDALPAVTDVVRVDDERLLAAEFRGWVTGEIAGGRAPVLAVFEDEHPVSVCFCARSSVAAEAGVETAARYRGRGLAPRVTAAWARTVRSQGRLPLYSTQWTNQASLVVARKLGLATYAATWSVLEPETAHSSQHRLPSLTAPRDY